MTTAQLLNAKLLAGDLTVAVAESLTGGLVCAELTALPGASNTVRGGFVAYATELKVRWLGVDQELVARVGAVHASVAEQMARGIAELAGADIGLATTGVAGPDRQDGAAVGTVFIAVHDERTDLSTVVGLQLSGDRDQIRRAATEQVLHLAVTALTVAK